jgi:hypothetical protein
MSWKSWVIVGVALAVMTASSGLLMASNMGFKINKAITNGFLGGSAPKGHNWISLPYNHPYPNAKAVCNALGVVTNAGTATIIDAATGAITNFLCGGAGPGFTVTGTQGLRFTLAGAGVPSAILVGSSNETAQLSILDNFLAAQAPKKYNWISVPYHTTWVKANDICVTLGNATNAVTITRIDAATGGVTNHLCGQGAGGAGNFSLVIGEAVRVTRAGAGVINFFPPHF